MKPARSTRRTGIAGVRTFSAIEKPVPWGGARTGTPREIIHTVSRGGMQAVSSGAADRAPGLPARGLDRADGLLDFAAAHEPVPAPAHDSLAVHEEHGGHDRHAVAPGQARALMVLHDRHALEAPLLDPGLEQGQRRP